MKKVLFLMFLLFLIGLGTANVKAQVRIGGNGAPNAAAVLDLNATDTTNYGTKGLALPRVSLASTTATLNDVTPITGMLVYNTNASMTGGGGVGLYFWSGGSWVRVAPYTAPAANAVTWTYVGAFSGIVSVPVDGTGSLSAPSVLIGDLCINTTGIAYPSATTGAIYFRMGSSAAWNGTLSAICYRPSR